MSEQREPAPREFTDEELARALKHAGEQAVAKAFAIGRPVMIARDGWLWYLHPDGTEERLKSLEEANRQDGSFSEREDRAE